MSYPSDLTDKQWFLIKDYFNQEDYGKNRKHSQCMLINAIFYIVKTSCQSHFLLKDYPP
jgi:putative transposase